MRRIKAGAKCCGNRAERVLRALVTVINWHQSAIAAMQGSPDHGGATGEEG